MSLNFSHLLHPFSDCVLYSSNLVISHQVLCQIDYAVVRCHGRLDCVIALLFHKLGCCHMKCCVPYIFGCYLMEKILLLYMKSSASVDWFIVLQVVLFPWTWLSSYRKILFS